VNTDSGRKEEKVRKREVERSETGEFNIGEVVT